MVLQWILTLIGYYGIVAWVVTVVLMVFLIDKVSTIIVNMIKILVCMTETS